MKTRLKEKKIEVLISNISEVVRLSILKHDVDTIDKGIQSLEDVAIEFLKKRKADPDNFEIKEYYLKPTNLHITYVLKEFERLFKIAAEAGEEDATRRIIKSYYNILDVALSQQNNTIILKKFFDYADYADSFHKRLLKYCMDKKMQKEKWHLLRIFVDIHRFSYDQKYCIDYIKNFIRYHLFNTFKSMIDKNDFDAFDQMLNTFASSAMFAHPPNDMFLYDVFSKYMEENAYSDNLMQSKDTMCSIVKYDFLKYGDQTLNKIFRIVDKLEKIESGEDVGKSETKTNKLKRNAHNFYIYTLTENVFFAVGAYLLYKGAEYTGYMQKLWYYTKPEHPQTTTYTNELPEIKEPLWQYCSVTDDGGDSLTNQFRFGDFSDPDSYFHQYYILLSIKNDTYIEIPNKDSIIKLPKKDAEIMFWYEILSKSQRPASLLKALDALNASFIQVIRNIKNKDLDEIQKIKESFKNKIKKLESECRYVIDEIEQILQISDDLINKQVQIMEQRYNESSIDDLSTVGYNENSNLEFTSWDDTMPIPRKMFIVQDYAPYIYDGFIDDIVLKEKHHIHQIISDKIEPEKSSMSWEDLCKKVDELTSHGFSPNVILIPWEIRKKIIEDSKQMAIDQIKINDSEINIIMPHPNWFVENIIIYDKKYLKTIRDKISIRVEDKDKQEIRFVRTVGINLNIVDSKAFVNLSYTGE